MTVAETLLVYAAAPLAVILVLAALTLRPDAGSRRRRYRPGQPWEHEPLWYAPWTGQETLTHDADTAAQPHGRSLSLGSSVYGEIEGGPAAGGPHLSVDGAAHEADGGRPSPAAPATAARRGGPLGGARGTW